jgi:hypothetical protein
MVVAVPSNGEKGETSSLIAGSSNEGALNFSSADDSSALNHSIFIRQGFQADGPSTGGYFLANVNDVPDVVRAADFATKVISNSNSGPVIRIRIVRAWRQIVSGDNYRLILELRNTNTGRDVLLCQVIVYVPLNSKPLELKSSLCAPKREICVQMNMMTRNVTDPDVNEMA